MKQIRNQVAVACSDPALTACRGSAIAISHRALS